MADSMIATFDKLRPGERPRRQMGHHPDDLEWVERGVGPVYSATAAPPSVPLMPHMAEALPRRPKVLLVKEPPAPNEAYLRAREAARAAQRAREAELRAEYQQRVREEYGQ